ncbi:OadG family protein [Alteromonas pelagimontana]|uniref:Probable oxaloacetate decarboxylase gamma chain n=1 Tax=Alteromonas pelagimontana TaxID=1858656 RepID=A0A6M4MFQ1_9ALTE|nr:OadG family protein [Alteromonas pelagimontana]QJR81892.1 OadG family protein [Alteromonas pelagimontana]
MEAQTIGNLLKESAVLMGVGMGVVFAFLALLIGAITAIAKLCARFPRSESETSGKPESHPTLSHNPTIDHHTVAAITAALHAHRNKPR